jgi:uncharacterized delta-60 repeat protein
MRLPLAVALAAGLACGATALARSHAGALDRTFGSHGIVVRITPDGRSIDTGAPAAVTRGGRIVVAAKDSGGTGSVLLERFTRRGRLDRSFGKRGIVLTDVGFDSIWSPAMALAPNGDIVVAGGSSKANHSLAVVLRYRPDGRLRRSFGHHGLVARRAPAATAMAIQRNGRILIATRNDSDSGTFAFRLTPRGRADKSFGKRGRVAVPGGVDPDSMVVRRNGRIVLSGGVVEQLKPHGGLDRGFGNHGVVQIPGENAVGATLQRDGRLVVAGYDYLPYDSANAGHMRIARLRRSGHLDRSFGKHGVAKVYAKRSRHPYGHPAAVGFAAAVQRDGKILATGYNYGGGFGAPFDLDTVRLTRRGRLDRSFAARGRAIKRIPHVTAPLPNSISLYGRRKAVVGAYGEGEGTGHIVLVRYRLGR